MSRQDRLDNITKGPKGEASSKANLRYWADLAEKNSYHGEASVGVASGLFLNPLADCCGVSQGIDKNHTGGSFKPGVRRES